MKRSCGNSMRMVLVVAGLALAAAGCTSARQSAPAAAPRASAALEAPRPKADAYPNINRVPDRPKRKLMTPEETEKVIADLEDKAKKQGKPAPGTDAAACDDRPARDPKVPVKPGDKDPAC